MIEFAHKIILVFTFQILYFPLERGRLRADLLKSITKRLVFGILDVYASHIRSLVIGLIYEFLNLCKLLLREAKRLEI